MPEWIWGRIIEGSSEPLKQIPEVKPALIGLRSRIEGLKNPKSIST
jgi:hypothetical protein